MTGQNEPVSYSSAQVAKVAFMAAGLGAACVMKDAPKVVMPTEEIERGVAAILDELRLGLIE